MDKNQNIEWEDKFEVAGGWPTSQYQPKADKPSVIKNKRKFTRFLLMMMGALLPLLGLFFYSMHFRPQRANGENGVFDPMPESAVIPQLEPLGDVSSEAFFTERIDTVINDVILAVYIPHNAIPELTIGIPNINDHEIILAAQAADVRADNGKILGAFVYKGEPKAWGLSKKGYCAILDGEITVGVSDNSPLFEEATERGGYFFRQYPLVDNGSLVDNEPKNKTMRKALCSRSGQIFIVVSESDESFHDFAQALVDLGIDNAVYLVGSHAAYGWYKDEKGTVEEFAANNARTYFKNETYIIWRTPAYN
jgi:hypothetical protein